MNKYEQLIEYIINDDEAKAKALFHDIVVAKSREIYESLVDEEEGPGGNPVEELSDEVTADEEGMSEDDEELDTEVDAGGFGDEEEMGGEEEMGSDEEGADMTDDEQSERILDLESALDELKAEFDALMADEAGEEEHNDGVTDPEFGGMDDMGGEFGGDDEEEVEGMYEAKKEKLAKDGKKMSEAERIREYVEKVSDGHGAEKSGQGEGSEVAKGGSANINKQSIVAGKNDMGGTAANLNKGGTEQAPDGTAPKGKAGGFVKGAQEVDVAKRNVNKVGGNKGAQDFYSTKAKARAGEGQTTDGSVPVSKNSLTGGRK